MIRTRWIAMVVALAAAVAGCASERPEAPAQLAAGTVPFRVPHDSTIPDGALGVSIRRGRALLEHTRDSLPEFVGNQLNCTSCHPSAGTKAGAMPWVGVYGQFPQYRSRSASVQLIEDRVDDCFQRSMNGEALPRSGTAMRDIVAYLAFLSTDIPVGARVEGQELVRLDVTSGDTVAGAELFEAECARCHGARGQGSVGPPLWGDGSFNVGAGMARLRTAAGFIKSNMPLDKAGSLTERQAADVAAFIISRPRPDLAGKEHDWPNGDAPPDAAYPTLGAKRQQGATSP